MTAIDVDRLVDACGDGSAEAGITIRTALEPLAGEGAPVKPATYAGGRFQYGQRWWGDGDDRHVVDTISIDNVPSQANRLEAALQLLARDLTLAEFVLDLSGLEPLPPHVPRRLSSFSFPHRNADAYLRDSELDGIDFMKTETGKAVFDATGDNADALLEWFPQALLFGFWQSHLGNTNSQAKLARSWKSELFGVQPAHGGADAEATRTLGTKGDALNLVKEGNDVVFDKADQVGWHLSSEKVKGASGKPQRLSEIGHGQVPFGEAGGEGDHALALSSVSFRSIFQQSTLSFASLRKIHFASHDAEARAYVAALGLVAHAAAFSRSFNLRSGCDLRPKRTEWTWLGASRDETIEVLSIEDARNLFAEVTGRANEAGLAVGSHGEPVMLQPKDKLAKVIRTTYPEPDDD